MLEPSLVLSHVSDVAGSRANVAVTTNLMAYATGMGSRTKVTTAQRALHDVFAVVGA